jgi:DNA-binding MarR family transcriptional regulator
MTSTTIAWFAEESPAAGGSMSRQAVRQASHRRSDGGGTRANGRQPRTARRAVDLGMLNSHLGYFIRRIQLWVFQDFIKTLAPINIGPAQFSVLTVIEANSGLSQSDLAEALGIETARLVRLLDELDRRDLTRRMPSTTDRRSHALHLTQEGQRILKRAKALAAVHEARLAEIIGIKNHEFMVDISKKAIEAARE